MSPFESVNIYPSMVNVSFGDAVTFECLSDAGPNNTFQWMNLETGDIVHSGPQLTIDSVMFIDGGDYECQVSNEAGFGSAISVLNSMYAQLNCYHIQQYFFHSSSCSDNERTR